jgi:hypothetical protein
LIGRQAPPVPPEEQAAPIFGRAIILGSERERGFATRIVLIGRQDRLTDDRAVLSNDTE